MKVRGVDYVQYDVADFAASVAFYSETLRLEQTFRNDDWGWAEFDAGNLTIALCGADDVSVSGSGVIALAVADIDEARAELERSGATVEREPVDGEWCTQFSVLDPDGRRIYIHKRKDGTFGAA